MRPIWKGHISFGLVNVPVTLYPAEQRTDLHLHMIDSRNHSRVRYQRVNAETGEEVPWDKIVRGYEYDEGAYVLVDDEELKRAAPEATKSIDLEGFVDLAEIEPVYFDRPYYLEPGKKGDKGYALLRDVLRETGKAGVATVVIRTRQYVAALSVRGDALVLYLLRYAQELRSAEELDLPGDSSEVGVTKQETTMARTLVDSMSTEWDPSAHRDEYREALMKWIEKRVEAGEIEHAPEAGEPAEDAPPPINMMEALKRSVSEAGGKASSGKGSKKSRGKASSKKASKKKAG